MAIGSHPRSYGRSQEWRTPPGIIEALGPFDLDPACPQVMPWKTAKRHLSPVDDGLSAKWEGRIWLNPPYDRYVIAKWMKQMAEHNDGIALLFARTETEFFFRYVWEKASAVFFIENRLNFYLPDGTQSKKNAGGPSVLVAYNSYNAERLKKFDLLPGKFLRL